MKKILITGVNGFIGNSLYKTLLKTGRLCVGTVRSNNLKSSNFNIEYIPIDNIGLTTNWKIALKGVDCIIHCAGRAHIMKKIDANEKKIFNSVNVDGTKQLAKQAAELGVKRLVFLSSIKVNGEVTQEKEIFRYNDTPNPKDAYAKSKLEAEKVLWKVSSELGLEIVIVRLPLVYGFDVKGNLARLINLVKSGVFLPLSLVKNQRSMIGMDNLVDLLIRCIDHPEASGKTFLASDGEDLSTPELIKIIASSIGKKANLFPLSISLLKFLGSIFGRREEINRLVGSLRIDNNYTKEILNWTPPVSVEEGIRRMVQGK
ncbi:NAD-dependent epimerase/dehydratase family protein [Pelagibacteraceae bacterium]|nr:NAD-dependent epimerase/dehydratase family protein [Pelagibacteraceae bacterium]